MGKVVILPEIELTNLLYKDIGLSSRGCTYNDKLLSACTRFPKFVYEQYDPEVLMDKIKTHLNRWASFTKTGKKNSESEASNIIEDRVVEETIGTNQPFTNSTSSSQNPSSQQTSSSQTNTSNPSETQAVSLNTTRTVVTRIIPVNDSESEEELEGNQEEYGFKAYAPSNPLEFSYWVTANLPLQDYQRFLFLTGYNGSKGPAKGKSELRNEKNFKLWETPGFSQTFFNIQETNVSRRSSHSLYHFDNTVYHITHSMEQDDYPYLFSNLSMARNGFAEMGIIA
ncbi:hypothetical protein RND71_043698 [Anisodus tanguticus]|uniref:Uncharacterized protein n=1 Tax=Anisodus tanguticus TaxID=243964 RepID=A0AAE1QQX5_9SOLA|nr:hypothetical protein RND71_043698 [Anisodus tanguticus]